MIYGSHSASDKIAVLMPDGAHLFASCSGMIVKGQKLTADTDGRMVPAVGNDNVIGVAMDNSPIPEGCLGIWEEEHEGEIEEPAAGLGGFISGCPAGR